MSNLTIRPAYSLWPQYNRRLRELIAALADEQLALRPAPDRWPIWATVGHAACQRVFWLCDFAGQPGAATTPFTDAAHNCPGDDDLDHPFNAEALVEGLDASFRIVENCLDRWTLDMLDEVIRRPEWDDSWHVGRSLLRRMMSSRPVSIRRGGQPTQSPSCHLQPRSPVTACVRACEQLYRVTGIAIFGLA